MGHCLWKPVTLSTSPARHLRGHREHEGPVPGTRGWGRWPPWTTAPVLSGPGSQDQPILASLPEFVQQHRPWLLLGWAGQELTESPVGAQQEPGCWFLWPQVHTKQGWAEGSLGQCEPPQTLLSLPA